MSLVFSIWVVQRILSNLSIVKFLALVLIPLLTSYFQMPDGQFDNLMALQLSVPSNNINSSSLFVPLRFLFLVMGTWSHLGNLWLLSLPHIQALGKSNDAFFKHYTFFSLLTALDQFITTFPSSVWIVSWCFFLQYQLKITWQLD